MVEKFKNQPTPEYCFLYALANYLIHYNVDIDPLKLVKRFNVFRSTTTNTEEQIIDTLLLPLKTCSVEQVLKNREGIISIYHPLLESYHSCYIYPSSKESNICLVNSLVGPTVLDISVKLIRPFIFMDDAAWVPYNTERYLKGRRRFEIYKSDNV